MRYKWVDTQAVFDEVISDISRHGIYAIDTEFHREKTYYPRLALVQLKWGSSIALVDPLALALVVAVQELFHNVFVVIFD
ncbi:MAG: ribonuclease D, partial [Actinomycetota bacterium]